MSDCRLPPCPRCGLPSRPNMLGVVTGVGVFRCVRCRRRYYVEEVPEPAAATRRGAWRKRDWLGPRMGDVDGERDGLPLYD